MTPRVNKHRVETPGAQGVDSKNSSKEDECLINKTTEATKVIECLHGGSGSSIAYTEALDPEAEEEWVNGMLKRLARLQEPLPFILPEVPVHPVVDSVTEGTGPGLVGPVKQEFAPGLASRKN